MILPHALLQHDCEITFEGNGTLSPNEMKRFERPQYVIEKDDKESILKSEMLTDSLF